ncbi:MAG: dTDP-4-amino-4,6-dideoxygalactose transaminase [Actinobacteria bacterium]|nr:dTDP-4-amino-4,6-dideoxygalactose transaminase [Actinomycetota bacterium]
MARLLFSVPYVTGSESTYVAQAMASDHWQGDGPFTRRAVALLQQLTAARGVILTTSCTHALELAAVLVGLKPGDEVICPSFTFSSTATAIVSRGAVPVFVDIEPRTLNIDPAAAEAAITLRTKAMFILHYGGVAADLDQLLAIADRYGLALVEDNAHGLGARFRGRHLGTFGTLGTQSFHETKNVAMGEGGALLVQDPELLARAEIVRDKGTNRARFWRGEIDKYTWVDEGSSYLPSDILAAVLCAQLEGFDDIQAKRMHVWDRYDTELADWAGRSGVDQMYVPPERSQPAHLYVLMMPSAEDQHGLIQHLRERDVVATFHYQPLDQSPAGLAFGRAPEPCTVTYDRAARLVRLPVYARMTDADIDRVIEGVTSYTPCC